MNKYVKKRIKRNIYRHGNMITYIAIFAVASIITLASVLGRTDKDRAVLIDDSQLAVTEMESIAMKNKDTQKVAAKEETEQETSKGIERESGTQVTIKVDVLNVRSDASQDAEALGIVNQGETFQIISQGSEWIEIDYNGNNGFVKAEFVEVN